MSTLISKQSNVVTLDALKALPLPGILGPHHAPVPHGILAESVLIEAQESGYNIVKTNFAISKDNSKLFAVVDLMPKGIVEVQEHGYVAERGLSLGFRNSTDSTLAIKMVAGTRVFVCDNLSLSGDMIAVMRRNTTGLDLESELREGFAKFIEHASSLDKHVARLQATMITDIVAKTTIFDIFNSGILPVHLFDDVATAYFKPTEDMTDCTPRTEWGLHNAFTRGLRKLPAASKFRTTTALGRAFGLNTN